MTALYHELAVLIEEMSYDNHGIASGECHLKIKAIRLRVDQEKIAGKMFPQAVEKDRRRCLQMRNNAEHLVLRSKGDTLLVFAEEWRILRPILCCKEAAHLQYVRCQRRRAGVWQLPNVEIFKSARLKRCIAWQSEIFKGGFEPKRITIAKAVWT